MMVLAAGSVTAFGCVGIAAITGYLPLTRPAANALGDYPRTSGTSQEQAAAPRAQVVQAEDPVVAVVAAESGNAKAIQLQAGKQPAARKPAVN